MQMDGQRPDGHDLDPSLRSALERAYSQRVDVETAARHLWLIHRAATQNAADGDGHRVPVGARGRARRTLVSVLTSLMMLGSSGAAVAASSTSLPGDVLYSVKRTTESARLLLSLSQQRDARLHLEMAARRYEEVSRLPEPDPVTASVLVDQALGSLEAAEDSQDEVVVAQARELRNDVERAAQVIAAAEVSPAAPELAQGASPEDTADPTTTSASPTSADPTASSALPTISADPFSPDTAPSSPEAAVSTEPTPTGSEEPTRGPTSSPDEDPTGTPGDEPTDGPRGSPTGAPSPGESEGPAPTATASPSPTGSEDPTEPAPGETTTEPTEDPGGISPQPAPEPTAEPTPSPVPGPTAEESPQPGLSPSAPEASPSASGFSTGPSLSPSAGEGPRGQPDS